MSRRPRTTARAYRVMRQGKTKRDRQSGAWLNHRQNKERRKFEGVAPPNFGG